VRSSFEKRGNIKASDSVLKLTMLLKTSDLTRFSGR